MRKPKRKNRGKNRTVLLQDGRNKNSSFTTTTASGIFSGFLGMVAFAVGISYRLIVFWSSHKYLGTRLETSAY